MQNKNENLRNAEQNVNSHSLILSFKHVFCPFNLLQNVFMILFDENCIKMLWMSFAIRVSQTPTGNETKIVVWSDIGE